MECFLKTFSTMWELNIFTVPCTLYICQGTLHVCTISASVAKIILYLDLAKIKTQMQQNTSIPFYNTDKSSALILMPESMCVW